MRSSLLKRIRCLRLLLTHLVCFFTFLALSVPAVGQEMRGVDTQAEDVQKDGKAWIDTLETLMPSDREYAQTLPLSAQTLDQMNLTALWREYLGVCTEYRSTSYLKIYDRVRAKAEQEGSKVHLKAIHVLHHTMPVAKPFLKGDANLTQYLNDDDPFIAHLSLAGILLKDIFGDTSSNLLVYRDWSEGFDRLSLLLPPPNHPFADDARFMHYSVLGSFYGTLSNIDRSYESALARKKYSDKLDLQTTSVTDLINLIQNHISRFKDEAALELLGDILKINDLQPRQKAPAQTIYALQLVMFGKYDRARIVLAEMANDPVESPYWAYILLQTEAALYAVLGETDKSLDLLKAVDSETGYAKLELLREVSDVNNALPEGVLRAYREKITAILIRRSWNIRARNSFFQAKILQQDRVGRDLDTRFKTKAIAFSDTLSEQYFATLDTSLSEMDQAVFDRILVKTKNLKLAEDESGIRPTLDAALLALLHQNADVNSFRQIEMLKKSLSEDDQIIAEVLTLVANTTLTLPNRVTQNRATESLDRLQTRIQTDLQKGVLDLARATLSLYSADYKGAWTQLDGLSESPEYLGRAAVMDSAEILNLKLNFLAGDLPESLESVDRILLDDRIQSRSILVGQVAIPLILTFESFGLETESDQLLSAISGAELASLGTVSTDLTFLQGRLLLNRGDARAAIPFFQRALYGSDFSDQKLQVLLSLYTAHRAMGSPDKIREIETQIEARVRSGNFNQDFQTLGTASFQRRYVEAVLDKDPARSDILRSWAEQSLPRTYKDKVTEREVALAKLSMLQDRAARQSTLLRSENIALFNTLQIFKRLSLAALTALCLLLILSAALMSRLRREQKQRRQAEEQIFYFHLFYANIFGMFHPTMHLIRTQLGRLTDSLTDVSLQASAEMAQGLSVDLTRKMMAVQILKDLKFGQKPETKQMVRLSRFLKNKEAQWAASINTSDVKLRVNLASNARVFLLNELLVETLIDILMSEALENTPHGAIDLSITRGSMGDADCIFIRVKDTGNGTMPTTVPYLDDTTANGLSLSHASFSLLKSTNFNLVPLIVKYMGGDLKVTSIPGNGTEVVLQIPVNAVALGTKDMETPLSSHFNGPQNMPANQR